MRWLLIIIMICAAPVSVWAETLYVDDTLRVNVRKQVGPGSEIVGVVATGDSLEVLQHDGDYLKIQDPDGLIGWVSKKYVTAEMPARMRMEETLSASEALKSRGGKLEKQLQTIKQENAQLQSQVASLKQNALRFENLNALGNSGPVTGSESTQAPPKIAYLYWGIGILMAVFIGFILGMRWQQARVARKLGGFNI